MLKTRHAQAGWALVATLLSSPAFGQASCNEVGASAAVLPEQLVTAQPDPGKLVEGKRELRQLVDTAIQVSAEARAAEHTRLAAGFDLEQTKASARPQLAVQSTVGTGSYESRGIDYGISGQGSTNLTLSGPVYDGGRNKSLVGFREQLLASTGSALESKHEQVVHEALLAVLDRNRLRSQLAIHDRSVAKLACLTELVERVVRADKGRASELVQARTGLYQAEVLRDELRTVLRQSDARVRRLLGNHPADWQNLAFPLRELPPFEVALQAIKDGPDVRQLLQQADAQLLFADSVAAEASPQVKMQLGFNAVRPADYINYRSWSLGLTLNYTLLDQGINQAARGAARERALAARQNAEQMLTDRTRDIHVAYEAANGAFKRAARLTEVVRDSDTVRNATYSQWANLGTRSLFDLISAETEHRQLGLLHVNAVFDGLMASSQVRTVGGGVLPWVATVAQTTVYTAPAEATVVAGTAAAPAPTPAPAAAAGPAPAAPAPAAPAAAQDSATPPQAVQD